MHTIHHEADPTLFGRRCLESPASSVENVRIIHLRTGTASDSGPVSQSRRATTRGDAGVRRHSEGSSGKGDGGNLCSWPAPRQAAWPARKMSTVLVDSDILIEVSRSRDLAILKSWDELGASDTLTVCSPVTVAGIWHGLRRKPESTCADIRPAIGSNWVTPSLRPLRSFTTQRFGPATGSIIRWRKSSSGDRRFRLAGSPR